MELASALSIQPLQLSRCNLVYTTLFYFIVFAATINKPAFPCCNAHVTTCHSIYIYIYTPFFGCNNYQARLPVAVATLSAQRSAVATCGMLFIYIYYFYFFVATITQPALRLSLPVATATKLASALSAQLLQLAVCLLSILNTFIYLFWLQQLLSLPSPACCNSHEALQHSLAGVATCRMPFIYIYFLFFYFFVATITEPAFPCVLQQSGTLL
jgi:hypothetical protein